MVRVDAPIDATVRDELKQEIKKELRKEEKHKKRMACGGCALVVLLLIGVPTVFVASVFAKTGLVQVPVLSSALYAPATPTRTVLPLGAATSESILRLIVTRAKFDPHIGVVTFAVKEQELTTLLQHAVWGASEGSLPFKIRTGQVVVLPNAVEVFLVLPRKSGETTALARFQPIVRENGAIDFDVRELRVGSQQVPTWLANMLVSALDKFVTEPIRQQVATVGTLTDVKAGEDGVVKFLLVPTKGSKK